MTRRKIAILSSIIVLAVAGGACTATALMTPPVAAVPVLMYHHLDQTGDSVVTVSEQLFEQQLDYMEENGYTTVSFDELIAYVNDENAELPQKPVAIVFDDGYESNYLLAYPALKARFVLSYLPFDVFHTFVQSTQERGVLYLASEKRSLV